MPKEKRKRRKGKNMNLKKRFFIVTLTLALVSTAFIMIPVVSYDPPIEPAPSDSYERYGPRVDDILFSVWGDVLSESEALAAGHIDVMDWATPGGYLTGPGDWRWDPEITLGDYSEWGWYEFDINNMQWPTGHGDMTPPGWDGTEPAVVTGHYWQNYTADGQDFCQRCYDARQFRRALAHLTDRSAMIAHMAGYAEPMETFCFPGIAAWENPDAPKYAYSLDLAEAALIEGGFQDWDDDLILEYSPGHDGVVVEELPTLEGWIRSDDPDRTFAGIQLRDDMIRMGIPLAMPVADRSTCYYHAWVAYDYHIYTGGWSWGRMPDMYFELWHSMKDTYSSPGADNYNRYHNIVYDDEAWGLKTATTDVEARPYSDAAQVILHRDVACIPLYTYSGFVSHRTNYGTHPEEETYAGLKWEGFVNELGYCFYSAWNPLNVHPEGFAKGGTYRHGLLVNIEKWSPVHAEWFYDWLVLDQIYEPLITYHPLDASKYVAILAEELPEDLTWELDGETCTRLRFELCPGALWHDNTPVTVDDVGFSFGYMRDEVSIANYWAVTNYYGYLTTANGSDPAWGDAPPPGSVDILYNVQSWLAKDWASGIPIIPKHIWEGKDSSIWNPEDHDAVIGTGPFMCKKDGVVGRPDFTLEYVHLEANPSYYCRYVWPDVCAAGGAIGRDEVVTMFDYGVTAEPDALLTYDPRLYPELPPWPTEWIVDGDQLLDADKDGAIDADDLLEIGLYMTWDWPPPWYEMEPVG
jgi:ABC-type transport system substrate-binding protein